MQTRASFYSSTSSFSKRNHLYVLALVVMVVFLSSCSATKHVPKDHYLLKDNKINLKTDKVFSDKEELKEQISNLIIQRENAKVLSVPYKIYIYNAFHRYYTKDSTTLKNAGSIAEAPVILDSTLVKRSKENMQYHLTNSGYFNAKVNDTIIYDNNQTAQVQYNINTGNQFIIKKVEVECKADRIKQILNKERNKLVLKSQAYYSNTKANEERILITNLMRNNGYYNFTAENVRFELDTLNNKDKISGANLASTFVNLLIANNTRSKTINIKTSIRDNLDKDAFIPYQIGKVLVITNYTNEYEFKEKLNQLPEFSIFYFHNKKRYINDKILSNKIAIRPLDKFSMEAYDYTLKRLNDLGAFKFVRIRYQKRVADNGKHVIDAIIMMSPVDQFDFNANIETSGGDVYAFGTAANVSLLNKNLWKGANQFSTTLSYGLELGRDVDRSDLIAKQYYLFSQNLGVNFSFTMPKFLLPYATNKKYFHNYPKTVINLGANALYRINYFFLRNINANINYQWQQNKHNSWSVKPLYLNLLNLSRVSPSFQARMDSIPAIKNAYQQTFILGESIEYQFNNANKYKKQHQSIKISVGEAGGLTSLINKITPLNTPFAQFIQLDLDARQYFTRKLDALILRIHGGVGIPYGKSRTLPYMKQYFVGGAYSIRGWTPRVLGPGSYINPNSSTNRLNLFIDQAGDIKLEMNAEYRFTLARLYANSISINGALFTDAGNIWLAKKDPGLPNAEFKLSRLGQDLAVSSGLGLRIDLGGFLVVRLDYAMKVKRPYVSQNYGWNLNNINPWSRSWRSEHTNFNLAIGYPF